MKLIVLSVGGAIVLVIVGIFNPPTIYIDNSLLQARVIEQEAKVARRNWKEQTPQSLALAESHLKRIERSAELIRKEGLARQKSYARATFLSAGIGMILVGFFLRGKVSEGDAAMRK